MEMPQGERKFCTLAIMMAIFFAGNFRSMGRPGEREVKIKEIHFFLTIFFSKKDAEDS